MEQTLYRIGEASTQLGLQDKNSNTLRSWVEEFKDFLGASANPEAGRPRFFTEDDMRVLRAVRDLRINHLPYTEIKERLAQGTHAVEETGESGDASRDQLVPAESGTSLMLGDQLQALIAPLTRAVDEWRGLADQYRSRLEDREARVVVLEERLEEMRARMQDMQMQSLKQNEDALALASKVIDANARLEDAQARSLKQQEEVLAVVGTLRQPEHRRRWFGLF